MALRQQTAKLRVGGVSLPQTFSNAFPSVPTPGADAFFAYSHYGPSAPSSVTIAGTVATLSQRYTIGGGAWMDIYRARVGGSPSRDIVVSGSGADHYITGGAVEVDALADTPEDQYNQASAFFSAGNHSISTPATTQADEFVIAQWTPTEGVSNLGGSSPAAVGYTSAWVEQDSNTYQGGEGSFKFVSTIGVQSAQWSKTVGSNLSQQIATYKAATGASENTANADITAQDATVVASGALTNVASAAITAESAGVAGAGALTNAASAALIAADAVASGTGVLTNVATGTLTTDNATLVATGLLSNVGNAALVTDDAIALGNEGAVNVGNAAITTQDATVVATGMLTNVAAGAFATQDAVVSATGMLTNVGNAAITTADALVDGTGSQETSNTANASITTDDATLVAAGLFVSVGSAAITAMDATVSSSAMLSNTANAAIVVENALVSASGSQNIPTERAIRVNLPGGTRKIHYYAPDTRILF